MGTTAKELAATQLCRRCEPGKLAFTTTEDLDDLGMILGQERALDAIRFGTGIRRDGYNLFAMGTEGAGQHNLVRRYLETHAPSKGVPADWCYVFNFDTPHKPRALKMPAGRAVKLRQDMARLVDDLRSGLSAAFESDEYRARMREIETEFEDRQEAAIGAVGERAKTQQIVLLRTPAGFGFAPRRGDGVMSPEEFRDLPEAEQKRLEELISGFQEELENVMHQIPGWRREVQHKLRELNRGIVHAAVSSLMEELNVEYESLPQVLEYLAAVRNDVLDHSDLFRQPREGDQSMPFAFLRPSPDAIEHALHRYQVNLLIGRSGEEGTPLVYENNPTNDNLLGRIEHLPQMGALVTDFTLIKPGVLHRANGGYLILDALKVLSQPLAWEALKRALRSREVRIESLGQALSLVSTVSLEPEPIPLDVKVVLVGQRQLYYLLHAHDPEFSELFKVVVDFEEDMAWQPEIDILFARMIATLARQEKLRPLDCGAVARVIEHSARSTGDSEKISIRWNDIADLLRESDYWSGAEQRSIISEKDVRHAINARNERAGRVGDRLREQINRGTLLIDTRGERAGQVNGLSVAQLGEFIFGIPCRITARVRMGFGRVVDIERESELGGPLHSKGVLILSGFIAGRYVTGKALSLSASLVFEQSYSGVDGDSASSAELFALLSAIADIPIKQSLAVTGSISQHGDVQAIGGVNEKIEGFFDVCRSAGLTGEQGVLIPAANVKNLMLRQDVVEAVSEGKFHIYPVSTVDEGLQILTGKAAGKRGNDGLYPAGSINQRVEHKLSDYARDGMTARSRKFSGSPSAAQRQEGLR